MTDSPGGAPTEQEADPATARPPLVLIGPMASGKTTLGRVVARLMDLPFIDSDHEIEREHGPIPELFETFGETHFRRLERAAVGRVLRLHGVVSLGGGAILDADTRADLAELPVVFLTVQPDVAAHRMQNTTRPLARGGIDAWTALFHDRLALYREVADVTFDTSIRDTRSIGHDLARWATEQLTR
ncbi:shikimate kinase [Homoserinimonas sp. OAct 916]|uniref:shikimate kinase n=1 Tax=Homoserinimonas sp. OAct 916 TaxID=2211450 RepID=UPI000DBE2F30|nr:shikimate kinase [Homoserinimonas sp. OAct 916]